MSEPTVREILAHWLRRRQVRGMREITNHDMQEVQLFGKNEFGKMHNVATYEREFRSIRAYWPWRFEDVSDEYPRRAEKTWRIKQREKVSD